MRSPAEVPDRASPLGDPETDPDGVWASVAALPERQRLAIAYHYLGGLPHTETAQLIGGTAEAVRRAAADGIRALRRIHRAETPTTGAPR